MEDKKEFKKGFFKKVYYSIFKLEKYGELSAEGVRRAIGYLFKLSLIISLIIAISTVFRINSLKQKAIDFLNEQVGEFTYTEGILNVKKEEPIRAPSSIFGEVIIDTNIETEEDSNNYLNSMDEKVGILILKDKVIVKGLAGNGIISYNYKNILADINITEMDKNQAIEYLNSSNMWIIYAVAFVIVFIYAIINVLLPILFNAVILSIFGYLVSWLAKVRIRYAAIFNLAAYSLTLSVLLNAIYIIVNMVTGFTITYFQVMYIGVAVIYLIAAILLLKSEFIRIQEEVTKIVQISKQKEMEEEKEKEKEQEEDKKDNKDNKEEKQKDEKQKDKKDSEKGEPEGSEA